MICDVVSMLKCPACDSADLLYRAFAKQASQEIADGVVWCGKCNEWFPIMDGLLDLLTGSLVYVDDKEQFWSIYSNELEGIGLSPTAGVLDAETKELQRTQQSHSDWYARNDLQTYNDFVRQPFMRAFDRLAFESWRKYISIGAWLLDIGCAEGRSSFNLMDLDINIVGFDVSKSLVRQAIDRYRSRPFTARAMFFVADATRFPFRDCSFDYVLIYGVLHHLPDPALACKEIARILKPNGRYMGAENNASIFRAVFDLLQKIKPLWYEEAGPQALLSRHSIMEAFKDTNMEISTHTSVFLPPHLVNMVPQKVANGLLSVTDKLGRSIPKLRNNGGLIVINGIKSI